MCCLCMRAITSVLKSSNLDVQVAEFSFVCNTDLMSLVQRCLVCVFDKLNDKLCFQVLVDVS